MNKSAFYKGIITELNKQAEQPLQVVDNAEEAQKKKPFYKSPRFWGGLGAVGLGAYGLHSLMKGQPTQPTPAITQSQPQPEASTPIEQLSTPPSSSVLDKVKEYGRIPINFTWGGGLALDALDNPDNNSAGLRGLEAGTGATTLGIGALANKSIANALPSSITNPLYRLATQPNRLAANASGIGAPSLGEAAGSIAKSFNVPYMVGMGGQAVINASSQAMENNSQNSGQLKDMFYNLSQQKKTNPSHYKDLVKDVGHQVFGNPEQLRNEASRANKSNDLSQAQSIYNLKNGKPIDDKTINNNLNGYIRTYSNRSDGSPGITESDIEQGNKALGDTPTELQKNIKQVTEPGTLARMGYGFGGLNLPKILGGKGLDIAPDLQDPYISKGMNNLYKEYDSTQSIK